MDVVRVDNALHQCERILLKVDTEDVDAVVVHGTVVHHKKSHVLARRVAPERDTVRVERRLHAAQLELTQHRLVRLAVPKPLTEPV